MNYEDATVWSAKITGYFGSQNKKDYSEDLVADILAWIRDYDETSMQRIFRQLKQDLKKSFKVDVHLMHEAATKLGILKFQASHHEQLHGDKIACDICGAEYEYHRLAPAFAFNGPACACPACGWYHRWTEDFEDAGSPGADEPRTLGPGYHKKLGDWQKDLDTRKRTVRNARRSDFDDQRKKELAQREGGIVGKAG